MPLFGVCLGQQAIGEAFGGRVVHAPRQMHGKTSRDHATTAAASSQALPSPFAATRYHSLGVEHDGFPAELRASAASDDGVIQGLAHRELPIAGRAVPPGVGAHARRPRDRGERRARLAMTVAGR